jgi:hypothetical protein
LVVVLVVVVVAAVVAGSSTLPYLQSERTRVAAKIWLIVMLYQHQDNDDFNTILTYFINL